MSPFEALFGYKPPTLLAVGEYTTIATVEDYLQLKRELASAQNKIKQLANRMRNEREFSMGEEVYLRIRYPHLKSIFQGPISKLSPKYYGPFPIIAKIGKVAYQLQLPEESLVFHVSLLKKFVGTQRVSSTLPILPKEINKVVGLEAIIDRWVMYKHGASLIYVLVKWQNCLVDSNTWEYFLDLLKQFPKSASFFSIS